MFIHNNTVYYNLSFLLNYIEEIREAEGIYYWVYYPNFDPDSILIEDLKTLLHKYTQTNLSLSEVSEQFKFKVEVCESAFPSNNRIFGLSSEKEDKLVLYLQSGISNTRTFHNFFQDACLRRPFYIGKALKLRSRLKQHMSGRSDILKTLSEKKVNFNDIWIGTQEVSLNTEESISNIFEEILQRIIKPGLTQRPG